MCSNVLCVFLLVCLIGFRQTCALLLLLCTSVHIRSDPDAPCCDGAAFLRVVGLGGVCRFVGVVGGCNEHDLSIQREDSLSESHLRGIV